MTPAVQAMMTDDSQVPTAPLDEFLVAYAEDPNLWWRIGSGHHLNLFEMAIERLDSIVDEVKMQGWAPFGTHVDCPHRLEFAEFDEGWLPKWERVSRD
jgi:hypothetical protein